MHYVRRLSAVVFCFPAMLLTGCEPLSLTLLGAGASAGISYTLSGVTYRTFSEPLPKVRKATLIALGRMSIKVKSTKNNEDHREVILAKTADRNIEVELEAISPSATRMRSVARNGAILMDSATATEIISQTGKALGENKKQG
jgi:hypothetical protein